MSELDNSYSWHFKRLMLFGIPLVLAQVLQMAIGVTDSIMVGKLGTVPLAQIGLGSSYVFFAVLTPVGFQIAVSVLIANHFAKNQYESVRAALAMGIWQGIAFCFLAIPFLLFSEPVLRFLNQPEESLVGAARYARILVWGMPFIYLAGVLRSYLTALERGNEMLIIAVLGFVANVVGNYALIYGNFGMPALGLEGSAYASVITNATMFFAVLILSFRDPLTKQIRAFSMVSKANWTVFNRLLMIGLPISLGLLSEVGMFQTAAILMGWLGVTAQAANTIVLNVAGLTFMIPLGLSIATSVRVGNALGRNDADGLWRGVIVSYGVVVVIMLITAASFMLIPDVFIGLFLDTSRSDSAEVALLAVGFFVAAAAFQVSDGIQVVGISALRGMQDAMIPAILAFICYWVIGVGSGYYLAFIVGIGGVGIWIGLAIGLTAASITMYLRLRYMLAPTRFAKLAS